MIAIGPVHLGDRSGWGEAAKFQAQGSQRAPANSPAPRDQLWAQEGIHSYSAREGTIARGSRIPNRNAQKNSKMHEMEIHNNSRIWDSTLYSPDLVYWVGFLERRAIFLKMAAKSRSLIFGKSRTWCLEVNIRRVAYSIIYSTYNIKCSINTTTYSK